MKKRPVIFGLIAAVTFICFEPLSAQEPIGLNPPSLQWRQFETDTVKLIFPAGLEQQAYQVAGIIHRQAARQDRSIGGKFKKVPVILQNQSTRPQGFATWIPWRVELFLTPPQNSILGAVHWLDPLTIHEYRHAQQYMLANQGFITNLSKVLMGNTGWALTTLAIEPLWFREGDAVNAETALTPAGRGRLPQFDMQYRALRLGGLHYTYEKAPWWSYRDFTPGPYPTGYYMVAYARRHFGRDIWKKTFEDAYRKKLFFYPLNRSLKKLTGLGTKQLYKASMAELDSIIKAQDTALRLTASRPRTPDKNPVFTSYRFPQYVDDSTLLAIRSSFREIRSFHLISASGVTKKIGFPGIDLTEGDHLNLSGSASLLTWSETHPDPRWGNRDYSNIMVFDLREKRKRKLTSRSRYFSPAASHNGKHVATIEVTDDYQYRLVILDLASGKRIKQMPNPDNYFLALPQWTPDDRHIIVQANNNHGMGFIQVDWQEGRVKWILPQQHHWISKPAPHGDHIYFAASYTGINNIFALDRKDQNLYQLTSTRFGAFDPVVAPDGKKLAYAEFSHTGYQLREIDLDPEGWEVFDTSTAISILNYYQPIEQQEGGHLISRAIEDSFPVKKYNALLKGLFNVYGWFPIPNVPEIGAEWYTLNLMSTLEGKVGALYNTNESGWRFYGNLSYAAFYPVVNLSFVARERHSATLEVADQGEQTRVLDGDWQENNIKAGLTLPLNLMRGIYHRNLELGVWHNYYEVDYRDSISALRQDMSFTSFEATVSFSNLRTMVRRQVNPRWGQQVSINHQQSLRPSVAGTMTDLRVTGFFPGLFRTHSFYVSMAGLREEIRNAYRFNNTYTYARGYMPRFNEHPLPLRQVYTATFNYSLPLFYPDWSWGSLAFIQRFKANFFFDYGEGSQGGAKTLMRSAGAEVMANLMFLRIFAMECGGRYSYRIDRADPHWFEFFVTRFEL